MGSYFKSSENSCSLIPNSSKFAKSFFQELTFYLNSFSLSSSIDFLSTEARISCHTLFISSNPPHFSIFSFQILNY
jgi:hypothetical protein